MEIRSIQNSNLLVGTTTTWNKETWHLQKLGKMKLIINFLITFIIQIQNMPIVYGIMKGSKNMNIKGIHANHGTSIHEWLVQTQKTCDDNVNCKSKKKAFRNSTSCQRPHPLHASLRHHHPLHLYFQQVVSLNP